MSHKKTEHLNYLDDVEEDSEHDSEPENQTETDTKNCDDIRDEFFKYIKSSGMPIGEFLTEDDVLSFINHTKENY